MDHKWIIKGLLESVLLIGSILLALAVDEWAEDRDYAELANQSLAIFQREILQNRARLEDSRPYHGGIRDLLAQMRVTPGVSADARRVMEGLEPPVLLNTAWETALATGALTHMDFEIVSALSLTYSIQETFEDRNRLERPRLGSGEGLSNAQRVEQIEDAYQYVAALTRGEDELMTVYEQALSLINSYLGEGDASVRDSSATRLSDG